MIPSGIVEDIRNRCDIESVVSSYVSLKRAGSNLKGLCPFHSEKTPSFTVYPGTQSFYCFGCGAGGDVISFVMRYENLDYVPALELLAKRAGITLPETGTSWLKQEGVSRSRILEMNLEAAKYFREMLFDEKLGAPGRAYLMERGLTMPVIRRFGIGYAPEQGALMTKHLKSLGFTDEEIRVGYLGGKNERGPYDLYRARVIFPILDLKGDVIAFGGRIIDPAKSDRKYLNTSDTPAFKKTKNLYALNYAKNAKDGYFILCEGYMDVITLHQAGFPTAVASLGTAFTEEQARIIKKYVNQVILCYDNDEAGRRATEKAIRNLESVGAEVKILRVKDAKDPDEYIKKFGAEAFRKLIEESRGKFDFFLDGVRSRYDSASSEEKVRALDEIVRYLAAIPSSVERDVYIRRTAGEYGVSEESIGNDVARARRRLSQEKKRKDQNDLIREITGSSDRVNPDFAAHPKTAKIEENLLGILFTHPEYLTRPVSGRELTADDMATDLGRRLLSFALEQGDDFSLGQLNEAFNPAEVSRVYQMIGLRSELKNDGAAWDDCVRALRTERSKENRTLSLDEILALRRTEANGPV